MQTYVSQPVKAGDRDTVSEKRMLSHTPEGKEQGDKKQKVQHATSKKCQRKIRYEVLV